MQYLITLGIQTERRLRCHVTKEDDRFLYESSAKQRIFGRCSNTFELSYNAENRDCWYQLSEDLKPALEAKQDKEKEHIYLVSVEEDEDGGE